MKKITEIAIQRPLLITVIFAALILFGVVSYNALSYNLLPKFDASVVTIITGYRGASADEIENVVTRKVEDAISTLEGVDRITSNSQEGASVITVTLKDGVDVNRAQNDAQRKIDQIMALLPLGIDNPVVNKFSTEDYPVLRLSATSTVSAEQLYDVLDKQVKPQLSNVPGVGQISLIGSYKRQIQVNINKDRLAAYKLSISQVANVINYSSISSPAGQLETPDNTYSIQFNAKFSNLDQVRSLVVAQFNDGSKIVLSDVADVVDAAEKMTALNHFNGVPAIGIQVFKQTDANGVDVSKQVLAKIEELTKTYSKLGIKFSVASDQSTYTLASAHAVVEDLFMAVIIVALVMLFFLHSGRNAMFVLVALPASMIPTFIAMNLFGMSLNLMTLMALSLVVGILVDDSIVILENITRHLEMGKDRRTAAIDGRSEIGFTALAITLVDVVVFVPLSFAGGLIGNILREFALVVVVSTLMSLIVCFTITPMLAARYAKLQHLKPDTIWGKVNIWFEKIITSARDNYTRILKWALGHKRWVMLGVIGLFVGSIALVATGFIGSAFISKSDRGELSIKLELAPQTAVYQTNLLAQKIEHDLFNEPEVANIFTNVGYSSSSGSTVSSNSNVAELNVILKDQKDRSVTTDEFGTRARDIIKKYPGVKVTVSPVGITGTSGQGDIQIALKGDNRSQMRTVAAQIFSTVAATPGAQYVRYSTPDPKPQFSVQLDREKMALLGLDATQVGAAISNAFRGNNLAKFSEYGNEYDFMVQAAGVDRTRGSDIRQLRFINSKGVPIELAQFAAINQTIGESALQRMDRLPSVTINANVVGRSSGTVGGEIKTKLNVMKFPEGVSWKFIGTQENQSKSFASLLQALGLGIVLIYLIMVALYENAVYPFVVLFALPLALIGAFLALALTKNDLTIFAMIGLIMLMGLVAKNGILLVDFTNQRKAEGASLVEALIDAGRERFRPILMTTIAMILGMLPIALSNGAGAEVKNGMAWVIIGGLTSSLILTLLVVPCIYYIIDRMLAKRKKSVPFAEAGKQSTALAGHN